MIHGLQNLAPNPYNPNDNQSIYCCTDIIIDDDILSSNYHSNLTSFQEKLCHSDNLPMQNDSKCVTPNINSELFNEPVSRSLSPDVPTSDLHLIPRNKINTFKSFRNSTFKLVPSGEFSSSLIKNSNNSNRFINRPIKSNVNENNVFINRINKNLMLRKITEIAKPYWNPNSVKKQKEFQRILPHPLFDNDLNAPYSLSCDNNSYKNTSIKDNVINSEPILKQNIINENDDKMLSSNVNIDDYEKMLEQKLLEIKLLKNRNNENENKCIKISNTKDYIQVYHNDTNKQVDEQKVNLSNNHNYKSTIDSFKLNINRELENCNTTLDVTGQIPCELYEPTDNNSHDIICNDNNYNKAPSTINQQYNKSNNREIEVCIDDNNKTVAFNEITACQSNLHIPLYFQCQRSGKKLRFKTRYLNKMSQAMKAFCVRMGITMVSQLEFRTPKSIIIKETDSPYTLKLKPNDIIQIQNALLK